jgi:hypothetical protein
MDLHRLLTTHPLKRSTLVASDVDSLDSLGTGLTKRDDLALLGLKGRHARSTLLGFGDAADVHALPSNIDTLLSRGAEEVRGEILLANHAPRHPKALARLRGDGLRDPTDTSRGLRSLKSLGERPAGGSLTACG